MKFIYAIFFTLFFMGINSTVIGMHPKKQLPSTDEKIQELISATLLGQDILVKALLEENININQYFKSANFKLGRKIKSKLPENSTINAFSVAVIKLSLFNGAEEFNLFLEHNPDINAQSNIGYTALMFAALFKGADAVKSLLEHGADPNIQNKDGNTALHIATLNEYNDIVDLLIKHGAKIDIKNNNGQTPEDLAVTSDNKELIEIYKNAKPQKPTGSSEDLIKNLSNLANNLTTISTTL